MLSRHEEGCKLPVSGVGFGNMAGSMHPMSSQKKAGQTGKAFWARDVLCFEYGN